MARIRSIKPDFFRHEGLQDLEASNPGRYPMLVFAGLWGHCDKAGRFEWRPRMLKLDILPFLDFDMAETLQLLVDSGYLRRYSSHGGHYGWIPSFSEHQRINGKESQEPEKYPAPPETSGEEAAPHPGSIAEAPEQQPGSNGEAPETTGREGKGRDIPGLPPGRVSPKVPDFRKLAASVIEALNQRTGRSYGLNGANADHVVARLKDGASVDLCLAVIDHKAREWSGDPEMAKYLRPETLFNRTKFATYSGEIGSRPVVADRKAVM